jgi:hypothetical protein
MGGGTSLESLDVILVTSKFHTMETVEMARAMEDNRMARVTEDMDMSP